MKAVLHTYDKMSLLFLVLMITTLPALCFTIKNVESRIAQLFLGKDGKLLDSSGAPNCGLANKIMLKSYTYNEMKCTRVSCNSVHEELSKFTALQLHQNCSFRQTCDSLHFPVPISLQNSTRDLLDVTIQYQCIDDQILDMCEKHKMGFNDTLYLTLKDYTKNLKKCECYVNEGAFIVTIVDLRLKSRKEDVCSTAELLVSNIHHFHCNPVSDSYDAIFGNKFRMKDGAYISLVPDSNRILPEMVWIQLTPEVSCQLECLGNGIASGQSTNMYTVTSSQGLSKTSAVSVVNTTNNPHSSVTTSAEEKVPTIPSPPPRDEEKVPTTPAPPPPTKPAPPPNDNTALWIVIFCLSFVVVADRVTLWKILWRKITQLRCPLQRMQNEQQSGDQSRDGIVTADQESEALSRNPDYPKSHVDLTKICESQSKQEFSFLSDNLSPVTIPNTPNQSLREKATPTNAQHYTSVKGREAGYDKGREAADVNGGQNALSLAKDNDSDFEAEDSEQKIFLENSSTEISSTKKKALFRK